MVLNGVKEYVRVQLIFNCITIACIYWIDACMNGMKSRNTAIEYLWYIQFMPFAEMRKIQLQFIKPIESGETVFMCHAFHHIADDQIERENFKINVYGVGRQIKDYFICMAHCVSQHTNEFQLDAFMGL